MAINSISLHSKPSFGYNPYNEKSPFKEMDDRTVGKEILGLARKGCEQLLEESKKNGSVYGELSSKMKYDFLLQKEADYSPEGIETSVQIGKSIRTFA